MNLAAVQAELAQARAAYVKVTEGNQRVELLATGGPGGANRVVYSKANAELLLNRIRALETAQARLGGGGIVRQAFGLN